jgi:hypothetical protein
MRRARRALALTLLTPLLLGLASVLRAGPDEETDPDEVPVVGRPGDLPFSGASGQFEVAAHAEPTDLEAETPLKLTVVVKATGPVRRPPRRIDLRQVPAFAKDFYFVDPAGGGTRQPDAKTWEFVYELKPRRTDVTEVPGVPFVFYNPAIRPATADKAFQRLYTDPIPLRVRPHEVFAVPLHAPEGAFQLATGPGLFARVAPWQPPGLAGSLLLLLAPPLLCAAWYVAWRRLYPDAARRAHLRRSRAARQALGRLHRAARLPAGPRAARAAAVVAGYLHERVDLHAAEPTPAEAAGHLRRHGCADGLAEQVSRFFESCDAARFLPAPPPDGLDLPEAAARLILAVEAATCPAAHS